MIQRICMYEEVERTIEVASIRMTEGKEGRHEMPHHSCSVCKRLHVIPTDQWKLLDAGDFVCSKSCLLRWLDRHLDKNFRVNPGKLAIERAVTLWDDRKDQPLFRSMYERVFADFLTSQAILWDYERFGFFVGNTKTYMPDFFLSQHGVFCETKGKWGLGQKKKLAMFRSQYPEAPLLVVPWVVHGDFFPDKGEENES